MSESECPCKGLKSGLIHAAALFAIIFLAVTAAIGVSHHCPYLNGTVPTPPAAALVK